MFFVAGGVVFLIGVVFGYALCAMMVMSGRDN